MDFGGLVSQYKGKVRGNVAVWGLIGVLVVWAGFLEVLATPGKRMFALDDPSISNPFTVYERYNDFWLLVVAVVVPLGMIGGLVAFDTGITDKLHAFYVASVEFSMGVSVTAFVTAFLKVRLAKLRPDFLQRCGPSMTLVGNSTSVLYDESVCTAPLGKRLLLDGYKSCPSGHSALAIAGLGYVTLWCAKRYWNPREERALVVFVSCWPLLWAVDVVCSRITDFRHSYTDVMLGTLVGCMGLFFAHFVTVSDNGEGLVLPI